MPLINVLLTPGAFDAEEKARFASALTEAACRAESVPDLPRSRARAIVMIEELPAEGYYMGGKPAYAAVRGVFMTWKVSAGVLDAARKAKFAAELHAAAEAAGTVDGRPVITSCVIEEIPEGQWAQGGRLRRLPEIAALAGFEHLASVADEQAA